MVRSQKKKNKYQKCHQKFINSPNIHRNQLFYFKLWNKVEPTFKYRQPNIAYALSSLIRESCLPFGISISIYHYFMTFCNSYSCRSLNFLLFYLNFFWQITGQQGKVEAISLSPLYHLGLLHRHLGISGGLMQTAHLYT